MAYKMMTLVVGPDRVDSYIEKLGLAINKMEGVDIEISLKPRNHVQVAIRVKVLKFTREHTWQDVATALSQNLLGVNVLLAGQSAAIYSCSESVVLR